MGRRGRHPYKYYSVYNRKTDEPVIIHAKTPECVAVTNLSRSTFFAYVTSTRYNTNRKRKFDIFVDEEDDEDG